MTRCLSLHFEKTTANISWNCMFSVAVLKWQAMALPCGIKHGKTCTCYKQIFSFFYCFSHFEDLYISYKKMLFHKNRNKQVQQHLKLETGKTW